MIEETVYHIGPRGLKDIRTSKLLKSNKSRNDGDSVSAFLGKPTFKQLEKMRDSGFKNYKDIGNASLYSLSLNDNRKKIKNLVIESIPENREYHGDWDNKASEIYQKANKKYKTRDGQKLPLEGEREVSESFAKLRKSYRKKRSKFIKKEFGFSDHPSLAEYHKVDEKLVKNWADFDKHSDYNIEHGSKSQYATHIPHIRIKTDSPLAILKEEQKW